MTDPLSAVSPLDGRYASRTEPLSPHVSEAALIRARVHVEIEYLIALADLPAIPFTLSSTDRETLRSIAGDFEREDAALVKRYETEGVGDVPATNHDVKAVEYFVRDQIRDEFSDAVPWIHFGLTSEDVNNLAYRRVVASAVEEVLLPTLRTVRDRLTGMARDHRDLAMLARTHGQPATPTTFGKEMAVYVIRLGRTLGRVTDALDGLSGKLAGASGTYAAHYAAVPDIDWQAFAREFVTTLGLVHQPVTTQVNPCDDLSELFDALGSVNDVLLDLNIDTWLYVSYGYLGQRPTADETGSSTMPHKVNPIDFENAEGNLQKANSDLEFLGDYLTTSRLQRDLSDSTVKRNIGVAFAHCLIGYTKTDDGLGTVVPNEAVIREDLAANPAVIGEAVQTILRREGHDDAYDRIKALTRGKRVELGDLHEAFEDMDIDDDTRDELLALTPATYTGIASDLVDEIGGPED